MKTTEKVQDSWAVHNISYDRKSRILTITMQNAPPKSHGEVLRYADVPERVYNEFAEAQSKGWFFNKNIRPNFSLI